MRISEEGDERTVHLLVRVPREVRSADIAARLSNIEQVRGVDWSP